MKKRVRKITDKQRLDWLENNNKSFFHCVVTHGFNQKSNGWMIGTQAWEKKLRKAVDAAMNEVQP